jgi:predicted transcriptional regulator of viral defense system
MDADEREIFYFLKTWGEEYVSVKEIARRASGKKKFHENPEWAKPLLMRMQERGLVESDTVGRYRIKPLPRKNKNKRWVSPDIAKILQESGVEVEGAEEGGVAPDDYYEQL